MSNPIPGDDAAELIEVAEACVAQGCTIAMEDWLEARAAAPVTADVAADLTNAQIRTIMHNYSHMHQPGHYSDTEFDCLQDVIGFVRECIKQAGAAGAPAETVKATCLVSSEANWPDAKIIEVLHSCGVDTYPSKHGFSATQVSATSIPTLRAVLEILATPSPSAEVARDAARLDFLDQNNRLRMGWYIATAPAGNVSVKSVINGGGSIREAIDAAMKLQAPAKEE